jgi:hypothetical protein
VLQEGEFERVGDETTRRVNVRILAATSHDLRAGVSAGQFRLDLFIGSAYFLYKFRRYGGGVKTFRYWQVSFFVRATAPLCPIFFSMKWTSSLGTTGQAI